MRDKDFTTIIAVDQTDEEVFSAVINVRGWWTGYFEEVIQGDTQKLNDEFTFLAAAGAHFSRQRLVEVIPNKKVVWLVTESRLSYLTNEDEWTGTSVIFKISKNGAKTMLTFVHKGLTPKAECYDSCAPSWSQYLYNRLLPLIISGC